MSSINFGLTTGRILSLALDPSDTTGNKLYVGTTGGGVWVAQNAATADSSQIVFTPLTDTVVKQPGLFPPSISIGALSVQPGGTGVILAGTGDPNDAPDSYYGAGILRSTDSGQTWKLIQLSADLKEGVSARPYAFVGESFAGLAWSTVSPQTVVAAVSQSHKGNLVNARWDHESYSGLYYSNDSGASWHLARIVDPDGTAVQGPNDAWAGTEGNAATAVVWNAVRNVFIAAVRFHGYYQSSDGVTWTRLTMQPGSGLTMTNCPTNYTYIGSTNCPIFRGALAVNPTTGDTFAWSIDAHNQDQSIWQDECAASGGVCTKALAFGKQWSTTALQTDTSSGHATIENGNCNLALAAVPSGADTLLLAGANDLWRCSLAAGCTWRNTTNSTACMGAQVGRYQHALDWNTANPSEVFIGNDYGLWRSMDAVDVSGSTCSVSDTDHFQNLNGGLGSLAEVESMAVAADTQYTVLAGLGVNGSAGLKGTTTAANNWPEILDGEGGPVAIDPTNANTWYVNNGAGVSIHACSSSGACTPADFGSSPAIGNTQVSNDGLEMTAPAPFLVDPLDSTQLLIGTCHIWRGPANGTGWTTANAVSSMLDGNNLRSACHGNALVRTMAAVALQDGGEVVYVGMYGALNGGLTLPGHVLRGAMDAQGTWTWKDVSKNSVTNDVNEFNADGMDVSNFFIDAHDPTGNTVYATIAGMPDTARKTKTIYRSTDGGAHWTWIDSNLPWAPANALVVDPSNANIAYVATDDGVFVTETLGTCWNSATNCWTAYGTGLPQSPIVVLNISANGQVLVAGTYGRGIWQIPLLGTGALMTTADAQPTSLTFSDQLAGTKSLPQTLTVTNSGSAKLLITDISLLGDFSEADNCVNVSLAVGSTCTIQIAFVPAQGGYRTGNMTISGNLSSGSIVVSLSGTGLSQGPVSIMPAALDLGSTEVGHSSDPLSLAIGNSTANPVSIKSMTVSGPFAISANACGTTELSAHTDCQVALKFTPTAEGPAAGTLTLIDDLGTQTAQLSGIGTAPPTDTLSPTALTFPGTIIGQSSAVQTMTLTNSGRNNLTSIQATIIGPFQLSSNCTTQLIGGASCSMRIAFVPTAQGTQTGTLTVSDIQRTQTVPLTGTGLLPPAFAVTPPSLSFGGQALGSTSAVLTLTVANTGGAPMANVGFQITGSGAANFGVSATTCGAKLDENASCTTQVVFTPKATGETGATLIVSSSTIGVNPASIPLNGTGQTATTLTASPAQLTFAPLPVGQTSPAQIVTLSNTSNSVANIVTSISAPFKLTQNTCAVELAPGAHCTFGVVFAPARNGQVSDSLTITAPNLSARASVTLIGTGGLTGALHLQPAVVSFPTTGVGVASDPVTITITNADATNTLADFAVSASDGFKIASTTCGSALAAGAQCTAAIAFVPGKTGVQSGTLMVASSTLAASVTASLSGEGYDYTVTPGTSSQTVVSGQTANYSFSLKPAAGAAGTFTFQCNSLPQYAGCVFSPSTKTVGSNASGMEALQITTGQASATVQSQQRPGWIPIVLACGLFTLPLLWRKRRLWLTFIFAILLASGGVTSCAGSGGGGSKTQENLTHTVAAGTYSIPVVVTSNGLQRTVTLTLVVN